MVQATKPQTQIARLSGLPRRLRALESLLGMLAPVPQTWLSGPPTASGTNSSNSSGGDMPLLKCSNYRQLTQAWRKALKWTDGLDHALAVMLASVASTKAMGDQLWVKVVGPASSGKSTLCEAISTNKEYILAKDTFKGLTSGYQADDEGKENLSLVTRLKDKTLIINDGDTLLQLPNLSEVISQLRAFYGRNLRTSYKNKMSVDHEGYNTTVILCGTSSLRKLDQSELGERFLDVVIMEKIDDELEDEILWRVVNRADRNMSMEVDGKPETLYEPELAKAMQLTGGYVERLRENANDVLTSIETPEAALRKCTRLGKFTAYMRARPSLKQDETAEREFASRLVSQYVRLAKCLAMVLNRKQVDEVVMRRVTRVAMDTSRGQTMAIAHHLYNVGTVGSEPRAVELFLGRSNDKTRGLLRFLRQIGVAETFTTKGKQGVSSRPRWRLTDRLMELYEDVLGGK